MRSTLRASTSPPPGDARRRKLLTEAYSAANNRKYIDHTVRADSRLNVWIAKKGIRKREMKATIHDGQSGDGGHIGGTTANHFFSLLATYNNRNLGLNGGTRRCN